MTLVALVLLIILPQCGNDESVNSIGHFTAPRVVVGPINAQNPYDSVGILHNERCEYFLSYIAVDDTSIAQKWGKLCAGVLAYAPTVGWTQEYAYDILNAARTWANSLNEGYDPVESLGAITSSTYITTREANYINAIGQAFAAASDSSSLMSALLQIESDMLGEDWSAGENVGLSTMSIAKHSFCMWYLLLDFSLQWGVYTACCDADAYDEARDTGYTEKKAGDLASVMSSLAAFGWTPGTQLPECEN